MDYTQPQQQMPINGGQPPMQPQPGYQQPAYGQPGYQQPGQPMPGQPMTQQPGYQQPQVYNDGRAIVYADQNQMEQNSYPVTMPEDLASGEKTDKEVAHDDQMMFVRKVLGIVAFELLLTFIIVIGASYSESFGLFCSSLGVQITSIFVYIFALVALLCSKGLRHSVPFNYIVLTIFAISLAFMVAGLSAYLTVASVLMSIGVLCLGLLTMLAGFLWIPNKEKALMGLLVSMFAACMIQWIVMITMLFSYPGDFQGLWILYCTLGVIICMGLIYFDLFIIMMAGKYAMDEYIYCSVLLYVDIVRMLLYLLMIFGKAK